MYDRDEYEYDVPGRRHRDPRRGGRRTGYSNTDPDFNPDDVGWQDRRDFQAGNHPDWDVPGSRRQGRSEGGAYRRDDFQTASRQRMDMPYGEEGEYFNRGRYGQGGYGGEYNQGYGSGPYSQRGFRGGRGDVERFRGDDDMSMGGRERRGYRHGREMDVEPRTGNWQRNDRGWRDDDHDRYETSWRGGVRGGGGNWRGDQGMSRGRVGGPGAELGGYGQRDFSGFGPQGYQRSSSRIREDICEILTDAPHIDPSNISIDVNDNGVVTLSGEVDSRRDKRRIEDCIDRVRGVRDVANNLTIDLSRRQRGSMAASQGRFQSEDVSQQKTSSTSGNGSASKKRKSSSSKSSKKGASSSSSSSSLKD